MNFYFSRFEFILSTFIPLITVFVTSIMIYKKIKGPTVPNHWITDNTSQLVQKKSYREFLLLLIGLAIFTYILVLPFYILSVFFLRTQNELLITVAFFMSYLKYW